MTKRIGDIVYIYEEKPEICSLCGELRELRPYGKNGAKICLPCFLENEEELKPNMERIFGNEKSTDKN